jgi:hypothetical protein
LNLRIALMSLHEKYFRVLSGLAPAGAVGVSLLLASATPSEADYHPLAVQSPGAVPDRLAAIREAVSAVVASDTAAGNAIGRLAWGNVMGNSTRWSNLSRSHFIERWGNYWHNTFYR